MDIVLTDIHKFYGRVHANADINLALAPGRIYGLLGENGAGKSTLMRILAGHSRPDRGELNIDGRRFDGLTPAQALELGVGMLYQDPLDFPALTVWENFVLGGRTHGRQAASRRLAELAARFDFHFSPNEKVGELTVGERQQLALLRLLDLGVKVLILDEPTTGISLTQKEKLFNALRVLSSERDRTIILVTHKLAEALDLCHDLLIMRQGGLAGQLAPPYKPDDLLTLMFGAEAVRQAQVAERPEVGQYPLVRLVDAQFAGDKFSLPSLTLDIRPGEIIGLAGLEGNGREILLRGLAGLARMKKGRLIFRDQDMGGRPRTRFRQAGIHFLPAARLEKGLFPELSIRDHLVLAFPEQKRRVLKFCQEQCVRRFRLQADPATWAKALSGGNQQRLQLSLIPDETSLLLMEHPTRGLDLGSARQVWETPGIPLPSWGGCLVFLGRPGRNHGTQSPYPGILQPTDRGRPAGRIRHPGKRRRSDGRTDQGCLNHARLVPHPRTFGTAYGLSGPGPRLHPADSAPGGRTSA